MAIFAGNASWYNLCNGSNGACAAFGYPCNNNYYHVAWPRLSSTGCYRNCAPNPTLVCGDIISTEYLCGVTQWAGVRDCCTCDEAGCSLIPRCDGELFMVSGYDRPAIDCTVALFLAMGGDLADGRIPVRVTTF